MTSDPKCTLHRDFSDASILDDFEASLERTLRGQLTDSGFYMGMFFTILFPSLLTSKLFRDNLWVLSDFHMSYTMD